MKKQSSFFSLPNFSNGSFFVFLHLCFRWSKNTKKTLFENVFVSTLLRSNTRFDDVSLLKRFKSIVKKISFGLKRRNFAKSNVKNSIDFDLHRSKISRYFIGQIQIQIRIFKFVSTKFLCTKIFSMFVFLLTFRSSLLIFFSFSFNFLSNRFQSEEKPS